MSRSEQDLEAEQGRAQPEALEARQSGLSGCLAREVVPGRYASGAEHEPALSEGL